MAEVVDYISSHGSRPINVPKYVILHTNGASREGYNLKRYINEQLALGNTSVTQPHHQVATDGTSFRYLDDNEKGVASYRAEGRCISVETADWGTLHSDINTQGWTEAQIEALAQICVNAHKKHGIPLRLPFHPLDDGGIGVHTMWPDNRYGLTGEGPFGHHFLNGRRVLTYNPWTTNVGKICPGQARKSQLQRIIDRARDIAGIPDKPHLPPPVEDDDMKPQLIQDANGIWVTADWVTYRGVSGSDLDMWAINGLMVYNADGTAPTVKLTDHRQRMIDMSPAAVNNRIAFIIESIKAELSKLPSGGSGITTEQINAIVTGVITHMPKGGTYTLG